MKTLSAKLLTATILGVTLATGIPAAWAQSPGHAQHHPSAPGAATPRAPDGSADRAMPLMDMCRQMMAGPMTGMGGDQQMEPKMMAHMLQMRGEMMKAMGEVMMKHGTMMLTPGGTMK